MKRIFAFSMMLTTCLFVSINGMAQKKKKASKKTTTNITTNQLPTAPAPQVMANDAINNSKINWLSWTQAQEQMKIEPKMVFIDIYTDWCGWCKVMDNKTFHNPDVIKYMNQNFYCIKFNSEIDNNITFQGKTYKIQSGINPLAVELLNGKLSYPTSVIFDKNWINPQAIPGYLDVKNIEPILNYLASGSHHSIPYETFKASYRPRWKE